MFKVNNINGEYLEVTTGVSSVLGKACHRAMQYYLGGGDEPALIDDGEALKFGFEKGLEYLNAFSDGMVEYNTKIPNRQSLSEKYASCFYGYVKELNLFSHAKEVLMVEKVLKHTVSVEGKNMPVPLKGVPDLVFVDNKDNIIIHDHKFVGAFSKIDEIDGGKLVQAAFYYFLVYAETGKAPYSAVFSEYKYTKNQDGGPQLQKYEIVFSKATLLFELFYRLYDDITNALLGNQVYIPNFGAMFDKEVAILAYIHRLDIDEERAAKFKKEKVDNITDFLKKKIEKTGAMKKYLETVAQKFISATTLNYKDMTTEEKIKSKLAEHGISLNFDSKITGHSVELYRYEPSTGLKMSKIEAFVKDIEQVIGVSGIRVLAPIPNSSLVGFEVPLQERTFPTDKPSMEIWEMAVGVDVFGNTYRIDPRDMPHMLVSGATGSGKSVFISNMIRQLGELPKNRAQIKLFDPKMVELAEFANGNNTDCYLTGTPEIAYELETLVTEMNARYKKLQTAKVRSIRDYFGKMPYIFVFIDEYSDLVNSKTKQKDGTTVYWGDEIKQNLLLLAQKSRACGIHIVLTTQRPSVKIIDGDIKAQFPTRVCFKMSSAVDSQVILDQAGAETLLGKGDMLFRGPNASGLIRLQGFA